MTRPEIERIRAVYDRPGEEVHTEMIADLCRYALAMEAARDAVLPVGEIYLASGWAHTSQLRFHFDAAVAGWVP